MSSTAPPTELAGYQLTEHIGSGGMGDVYKAWNPALQRTAAVKVLRYPDMADRFHNEAKIQASIRHPHIAQLYEFRLNGPHPCIIMEYVEGETLDQYRNRKGRLTSPETRNIIRQIADALAYLHQRDLQHRDIKPANFKISSDGQVKMLDFGIARDVFAPRLTQLGFVVGTTDYMSPEQFRQQVDQKSDCWALGVMTYELLTGYLPFEASNVILLQAKILKGQYTSPRMLVPGMEAQLVRLIDQCLKINQAQRISAADIVTLLAPVVTKQPLNRWPALQQRFQQNRRQWLRQARRTKITDNHKKLAGLILGALFLLFIFTRSGDTEDQVLPANDHHTVQQQQGKQREITISVTNSPNAYIILSDGSRRDLPFQVKGVEGTHIDFTIHAPGYRSMKQGFDLSPRRSTYDYTLDKLP